MNWFDEIFTKQVDLQKHIKNVRFDADLRDVKDMYGAATAAIVEIGEMLQFDTRWKQYITGSTKEPKFDYKLFKEEWVDAFLYMLNTLIYAGVSFDEMKDKIQYKQDIVIERLTYNKTRHRLKDLTKEVDE